MTSVLIAFSDTGGGHRAAATAVGAAIERLDPFAEVRTVDPYAMSHRWPFDRLASAYPKVVDNASWLWRSGFRLTNTTHCTATLQALAWPALRGTFRDIRSASSPDVIVSTHSLLTTPLRRVYANTPLAVVVTDLVSGHNSWYQRRADLIITPTEQAREQALRCGVAPQRVEVLGLPVDQSFVACDNETERGPLRQRLGWHASRPTIVLMGGGDGVGPLREIAHAIDAAQLPCDVAVVTGRNTALAEQLRSTQWNGVVHVYGFVSNLGEMLRAAQALVTKAGPGSISEAFAARCPLILYGAIPGQESGNVRYVCDAGAGVWAPSAVAVKDALQRWLVGTDAPSLRNAAAQASAHLARPDAATDIARRVLELAESNPRSNRRATPTRWRRALTFGACALAPASSLSPRLAVSLDRWLSLRSLHNSLPVPSV